MVEYDPKVPNKSYRVTPGAVFSPARSAPYPQPLQMGSQGNNGAAATYDERPWDLVSVPATSPTQWKLHDPFVIWRQDDLSDVVTITNTAFTPVSGRWIVAKMEGPIATFDSTPTIVIEQITEASWTSYPSAFEFDTASPYAWEITRVPLYKIVPSASATSAMKLLGEYSGDDLYADRYCGCAPELHYMLATATSRLRMAPTLT